MFAGGGETLDDSTETFTVMAENPDHGSITVRSRNRGRAHCQVALEMVRSVEEIGPSDGG